MERRGCDLAPVESLLVHPAIAHTDSRQAKSPHRVQSMPPERSLPRGAIFAPPDVTQPQFEANTKASWQSRNEAATHWTKIAMPGFRSRIPIEPYFATEFGPKIFEGLALFGFLCDASLNRTFVIPFACD